tara:strand:+ start:46 stop:195 length:150 start_codon:yes stop_codon:yes gene_type:complete
MENQIKLESDIIENTAMAYNILKVIQDSQLNRNYIIQVMILYPKWSDLE